MKAQIAEKLKIEIAKIDNAKNKMFLEKIFEFETENDIDLEKDHMLCGVLPELIASKLDKDIDGSVCYQQYRTMKSILIKQDIEASNNKMFEESLPKMVKEFKKLHPELTEAQIEQMTRDAYANTNIMEACNNLGIDLTKDAEQLEEDNPGRDLFSELLGELDRLDKVSNDE